VLFRLTGPAVHVGANGQYQTTDLTGCVVNGAAYGELSSEKVYIRLQRISCPAGNRQFSVATVEGYASHLGKAGVRGNVISREGGLTGRAMIAGTLQGLGNSLSSYTDRLTNSIGIGAGGALTAPEPPRAGDVATGAAGAGVANAAEMLADYYINRAEQYQPVIEMPTGIEVELVFLSGFEIARGRR
jgi:conjugal transfer pilus assembly protein TraB